jgi:hypothetical protein
MSGSIGVLRAVIRQCLPGAIAFLLACPVWACTPPRQRDESGFDRANVKSLPKNARGVMFYLAGGIPRSTDFQITSAQDKRPLSVRVRAFKGYAWVRVEPVSGFQAGASYEFRYLGKHGDWANPDVMRVTIDDVVASSSGEYAISQAARPAYKVIIIPTSAGSCVEPSPAAVQEFTYSIPPAMERYRDALLYSAHVVLPRAVTRNIPFVPPWTEAPTLYEDSNYSLGLGIGKQYDARNNAVVLACGARWRRARLAATVIFPELDMTVHRVPTVDIDLDRHVEGECEQLEALLRTIDWRSPESSLRAVCQRALVSPFPQSGQALRTTGTEEWERGLNHLYGMVPTCNLVALAYLWNGRQYDMKPETFGRIGRALAGGLQYAEQPEADAAVHALTYVVNQLPGNARHAMARSLLMPLQPALVDALAEPRQRRAGEIASLIRLGGELTADMRRKLQAISISNLPGRDQARQLLAGPAPLK